MINLTFGAGRENMCYLRVLIRVLIENSVSFPILLIPLYEQILAP